jgi:hypothetical protein
MGNRDIPSNIPTDFNRILEFGVYKLYAESKDEIIIKKFLEAIYSLLNSDVVHIWCAFVICWSQIYNEQSNSAPFECIDDTLLNSIKKAIYDNEIGLKKCFDWLGSNCAEGLWQHIVSINNSIKNRFGVELL